MTAIRRPGSLLIALLFAPALALSGLALSGVLAPLSAASRPAPAAFLSNLDDVPLMPGLAERKDLAISFDKPEGRIVEAYAEGRLTAAEVAKFYAATLPQLGWQRQGNNRYAREGEELLLRFTTAAANKLTVQFALSPKP